MKKGINIWSFKSGMPVHDCIIKQKKQALTVLNLNWPKKGKSALRVRKRNCLKLKDSHSQKALSFQALQQAFTGHTH